MNAPPSPFIEDFPQRLDDGGMVLFGRDFFLRRAIETD
jgi:hypothetical protein